MDALFRKARIETDIWTALIEDEKRRLMKEGLSEEQADERATAEIRRQIRNS